MMLTCTAHVSLVLDSDSGCLPYTNHTFSLTSPIMASTYLPKHFDTHLDILCELSGRSTLSQVLVGQLSHSLSDSSIKFVT
jgi:hypothetical protein